MKQFFLLLPVLLLTNFLRAQGDLIIFSERGERFTLYIDGDPIAVNPSHKHRINNLYGSILKGVVVFEDPNLGSVSGDIVMEKNEETTYMIKRGDTGKYRFNYRGHGPINRTPNVEVSGGQTMVIPAQAPPPPAPVPVPVPVPVPAPAPAPQPQGCPMMSDAAFNDAKNSISSKGFENTKVSMAKQIAQSNCLTAAQIRDVCKMFSFDNNRLDFAKFAYKYCYDPRNYYMVNDAFQFESNGRELSKFIGN